MARQDIEHQPNSVPQTTCGIQIQERGWLVRRGGRSRGWPNLAPKETALGESISAYKAIEDLKQALSRPRPFIAMGLQRKRRAHRLHGIETPVAGSGSWSITKHRMARLPGVRRIRREKKLCLP
jgi:hypothetical protein